nr:hypothetical protein [uncultured Lichenicoccus sp.]
MRDNRPGAGVEAEAAEAVDHVGRPTEIAKVANAWVSKETSIPNTPTKTVEAASAARSAESEVAGGAANPTTGEAYKASLRAAMAKPPASDPKLKSIIDDLYRDNATIGSGSTAAAVRHDLVEGEPVKGTFQKEKATRTDSVA